MIQAITLLTTDEAALICDALDGERVNTSDKHREAECLKLIRRLSTDHDLETCDVCELHRPCRTLIRIDHNIVACPECAANRERGWTPNG